MILMDCADLFRGPRRMNSCIRLERQRSRQGHHTFTKSEVYIGKRSWRRRTDVGLFMLSLAG